MAHGFIILTLGRPIWEDYEFKFYSNYIVSEGVNLGYI